MSLTHILDCECELSLHSLIPSTFHLLSYLDVQGGEVAVEVFGVIDVRLPADWTHHVSDVFVPHCDGEVLLETTTTHRTLARSQRLHLREKRGCESRKQEMTSDCASTR